MSKKKKAAQYVLCVKNDDYPVSLEVRKIYEIIPDGAAAARHYVRIIDESGDDYLYPAEFFVAIDVPKAAAGVFSQAS